MWGGGNIFDKIKCQEKIGYDKSRTLIALFNKGLESPQDIPAHGSREWWDRAKAIYKGEMPQDMEDWEIGAIQFFGSFGTRGFPGGYANNKKNKDYYNQRYNNFMNQLKLLRENPGKFICSSYDKIEIPKGSVVYCDPPYEGTKTYGYKFETYFDYQHYWNWVREISKDNYVFCSEGRCPDDFKIIWSGEMTRLVSAKNDYKGKEILCTCREGLANI